MLLIRGKVNWIGVKTVGEGRKIVEMQLESIFKEGAKPEYEDLHIWDKTGAFEEAMKIREGEEVEAVVKCKLDKYKKIKLYIERISKIKA